MLKILMRFSPHRSPAIANRRHLPLTGNKDKNNMVDSADHLPVDQALKDSEARTRAILDAAVDAIITIDERGAIESMNPAAERLFGYSANEAVGQNVRILMPSPYKEEHDAYLHNYLTTGERKIIGIGREVVGLRKDKTTFPMHLAVSELRLGDRRMFTGIARDITDLADAHRRLAESEARTRAILDAAVDAIITIDEHGVIESMNPAAERLFGYSVSEIAGRNVNTLMPSPYREEHDSYLRNYLSSGLKKIIGIGREVVGRRKDGMTFPMELAVSEVVLENRRLFTGIVRDITDRKRLEEQREQLLESERAARNEAERAGRMKDEFLATLSHELRTPLSSILGYTQVLRMANVGEAEIRNSVAIIERNALLQARLIEDLLDMNRILSGKVRLDMQMLDLAAVIEASINSIQPTAEAKGVEIQKFIDPHAGPVRGDPARVQQIIWNLVSNAIKFTSKGGKVQVSLERVNSHIEIIVSDNGQGIAPEFLPYVFDKFRQADASITRSHGGLGLGLSIVRHLVELHGGTVRAKSPGLGAGSMFTVTLPMLVVQHDSDEEEKRVHPKTSRLDVLDVKPDLANVRILIVDDDFDGCALVKRLLQQFDALAETVHSAEEAIEALRQKSFDLLISDIGMPGEDGYQLVRRLRTEAGPNQRIPAIALTAFARSEDRRRAALAGFQTHLTKPVDTGELVAVVANLAGRTQSGLQGE